MLLIILMQMSYYSYSEILFTHTAVYSFELNELFLTETFMLNAPDNCLKVFK